MGARGSSLVGKAVVDEKLMPYTSYGKRDILEVRLRHLHDLGGRFALGRRQFASLLHESEDGDNLHILFDTDKNGLVDALEVIAALTMLSSMTIKEKIDIIHSLYDFNGAGSITIDEMTILLRTVASGSGKMDKGVLTPTTREVEELAKWAFRKAGLDTDSEISKFDFDDFCLTNPTVRTFLDYWAGASNQVVIARGELWVDPVFKPNGSSLYFSLTDAPGGMLPAANVKWLRPKMFCPGTPKLYSDGGLGNQLGDGVGALRPGQMANHWFMNALSLVGSRPSLLRSLFVWTGQEKQGRFCLRFFKEERWLNVVVDDQLPCDALGQPLFARSGDPNEIWPMLVEKAYAKLHKCYQALIHGTVEYALRDLTGSTVERLELKSREMESRVLSDEFWKKIVAWSDCSRGPCEHIMGCAWTVRTRESVKEGGTLQGLEFAVMHTVLATAEYKQFRLVRVRNPWGRSFFNGEWSNGSSVWAKAPAGLVDVCVERSGGVGAAEGGDYLKTGGAADPTAFWMSIDDFVGLFDVVVVAHLHETVASPATAAGGWTHQYRRVVFPASGGGNPTEPTWTQNPQFYLEVSEPTVVQASLSQPDARFHGVHRASNSQALGLVLHAWDWGADTTCVRPLERLYSGSSGHGARGLVARTEPFRARREVTLTAEPVTLEPGKYVLVPMTFATAEQGRSTVLTRQCWLSVLSKSRLYPLKLYSDAEVDYDDPSHVPEGVNDTTEEYTEETAPAASDVEKDNETVALASLSDLVSKMWTLARQLEFRKLDLEEKVAYLEEEKSRAEEEAAEAALDD